MGSSDTEIQPKFDLTSQIPIVCANINFYKTILFPFSQESDILRFILSVPPKTTSVVFFFEILKTAQD